MTLLPPEAEYPMELFQWFLPNFSVTGDFQIVHFGDFEQFKVDIHLTNFWATENWPYSVLFMDFVQVTVILPSLGKTCREKQSKPSPFDKNSRTTFKICHKSFSMIQQQKSRTGFLSQWIAFKGSVFYFFL